MAKKKSKNHPAKKSGRRDDEGEKSIGHENEARCKSVGAAAATFACAVAALYVMSPNDMEVIDYGNHNTEWEDGHASWDEFGHDNDPSACGLPILTVEEWERGRYWEGDKPVLVRNVTSGWPALKNWKLQEMLSRYPDVEATMGDAQLIGETGPDSPSQVLTRTTVKKFITKHMYDPKKYFFDRRIAIPENMLDDCRPVPMPTRAFFLDENKRARGHRWRDHFTISMGSNLQGLTFHSHGAAWNVVVFGAKRWILWEHTSLNATMQMRVKGDVPAREWIRTLHSHPERMEEIEAHGHDCIQHAGDMLFVPDGCMHMVVNIGDTVAVVSEIDLDKGEGNKKMPQDQYDGKAEML
ncbi:hypothetical protein ACHAWF_018397 [Thalassiosira exigua]